MVIESLLASTALPADNLGLNLVVLIAVVGVSFLTMAWLRYVVKVVEEDHPALKTGRDADNVQILFKSDSGFEYRGETENEGGNEEQENG